MAHDILCVARGRGDRWEALCLDFDIAVQGRSFDEVRSMLSDAVTSYIADAEGEAEPARSKLLQRTVPLHVRLLWAWRFFRTALSGTSRDGDSAVGFPVECPA
jgi:hypothetical protein